MKFTFISPTGELSDEQLVYKSLMQMTTSDILVLKSSYKEEIFNIKSMAERLGITVELVKDPMAIADKIVILGKVPNDEVSRVRW